MLNIPPEYLDGSPNTPMRPSAHFIHGAFDGDGEHHIDWLAPFFAARGFEPITGFDYGWTGIFSAMVFNERIARMLAAEVAPGDIGVGHSNGCAILKDAADMGAPFHELILLNPALDNSVTFAPQLKRIHVFYSPSEIPTEIARYLPLHPWGNMGRVGYRGNDPRVINVDLESAYQFPAHGHIYFSGHPEAREWWGPQIAAVADVPQVKEPNCGIA